jgi:hypothetical protein
MIRRILVALGIDHRTYYCASCGGWYPISHFENC